MRDNSLVVVTWFGSSGRSELYTFIHVVSHYRFNTDQEKNENCGIIFFTSLFQRQNGSGKVNKGTSRGVEQATQESIHA